MLRLLRFYLLGCIAITFGYLLLHAREPLRLNVGDSWSDAGVVSSVEYLERYGFTTPLIADAYRPVDEPPVAELFYAAIGEIGAGDIGTFRLFALAFSMLGTWLLFLYARRIWGDTVALLATALYATSVLWMMYADSIHRLTVVDPACFLALWGLVRAIETRRRRYYAAVIAGSFACLFTASDDWLLLPAGVLFTIYIKLGNPFARGNRRFLVIAAAGYLAALYTRSLFVPGPLGLQVAIDQKLAASLSTLVRRYTLVFTPMFWVTLGYTAWRALRAPSLSSVIEDGMTWLLAVAVMVLYTTSQHTGSSMLGARPLLPFYAIGSAILIARLLEEARIGRALAAAWAVLAPVWGLYIMFSHPRSVLDREEVAKVRTYLATHDRNDFVMSNLLADGPIEAAFGRNNWPALTAEGWMDVHVVQLQMLEVFAGTGTDYVHAVLFTTPDSRFVDRSLGQLVIRRRLASVTGWPYVTRSRAHEVIADYDKKVFKILEPVGAKRVLHLSNFDVYRIDRATVLELASRSIPVVREIDFSSPESTRYKLLGWSDPQLTATHQIGATSIDGYGACASPVVPHRDGGPAANACETVQTQSGLWVVDRPRVDRAELMIRVERACDLRLTIELASSSQLTRMPLELASAPLLAMSINDFTASQCAPSPRVSFIVPRRSVRAGVNIIALENRRFGPVPPRADVVSLAVEPICEDELPPR